MNYSLTSCTNLARIFLIAACGVSQLSPSAALASEGKQVPPMHDRYFNCAFRGHEEILFATRYDPETNAVYSSLSPTIQLSNGSLSGENRDFNYTFYFSDELKLSVHKAGKLVVGDCKELTPAIGNATSALQMNFELANNPFSSCNPGISSFPAEIGALTFTELVEASSAKNDLSAYLIYFGTATSEVTRSDLSRNTEALALVEASGYGVEQIFVDVAHKTVGTFGEKTGNSIEAEKLEKLVSDFKVYFRQGSDGTADHSTFSYVVFPELGVVDFLRRSETAQMTAEKVKCLIQNSNTAQRG